VSLESANEKFGRFLRRQVDLRSAWLKVLLAYLAVLVLLNLFLIKPHHEPAETAHPGEEAHGALVQEEPGHAEPAAPEALSVHGETDREAAADGEAAHGEPGEGEVSGHEPAEAAQGPEEMQRVEGVELNYYPHGSHEYGLVRWLSGMATGRAALAAFHTIHAAEDFPAFWALFGVFCAWLLVRLSKGSAHTFLGKPEDFYDR